MMDFDAVATAIRQATEQVFSTMLEMEVRAGEPRLERDLGSTAEGVVSLIGMAGAWMGTGSLALSASLACKISSRLLLSESSPCEQAITEEVLDAIGELTNMILGNTKNSLEEHLGLVGLSIPTVIYGRNVTTRSASDAQWVVVPFQCEREQLEVRLCLAPSTPPVPVRHGFKAAHSLHL